MPFHQTDWMVLLIGGSSGVGKTMVAKQLGPRFDASWLQVDDVRLAFQRSRVTLAERTAALYFFLETPHIWTLPPERLRDGLIEIGQVLSPALEVVIENHVDTAAPSSDRRGWGSAISVCPLIGARSRSHWTGASSIPG
jgi:hypothetical protein